MPNPSLLVAFTCTSIINYSFGLTAAWFLLPGDFGLLAFAQTVLLIGGLILESGIPWSLVKSLRETSDRDRPALILGAITANCLLALVISFLILVLFGLGYLGTALETWTIAGSVALAFPFIALACVARGAAQGMENFLALGILQLLEVATKAAIGTLLMILGWGATGAVAGALVGAVLAAGFGLWRLHKSSGICLRGRARVLPVRSTSPLFAGLIGLVLILNLDLIGVKIFATEQRDLAGYYQAALMLASAPYYLVAASMIPVLFTRLPGAKSVEDARVLLGEVIRSAAALVVPLELVFAVAPELVLSRLFPEGYIVAAPLLRLLAVGKGLVIFVAIMSSALQAIGLARTAARILLTIALGESVVLSIMVPSGPSTAAASVAVVCALTALIGLSLACLNTLRITTLRDLALWWVMRYTAALLLATAGGTVMAVITGAADMAVAVAVAVLCYMAAAVAFRLIPMSLSGSLVIHRR